MPETMSSIEAKLGDKIPHLDISGLEAMAKQKVYSEGSNEVQERNDNGQWVTRKRSVEPGVRLPGSESRYSLRRDSVSEMLDRVSQDARSNAWREENGAIQQWEGLGQEAHNRFGTEDRFVALAEATRILDRRTELDNEREVLAVRILDEMQAERSNPKSKEEIFKIVDRVALSQDELRSAGFTGDQRPTIADLRALPAFRPYRDRLVQAVISEARNRERQTNGKGEWLKKNVWEKGTRWLKSRFSANAQEIDKLVDEADKIDNKEAGFRVDAVANAGQYKRKYDEFVRLFDRARRDKVIAGFMPGYERNYKQMAQENLNYEVSRAQTEAIAENERRDAETAEQARLDGEMQARLEAEAALAQERLARVELHDLSIQATSLAEAAEKHAMVAQLGLSAMAELKYSEDMMAQFDSWMAEGKLPPQLEGLVHGDVGEAVDTFIKSKGKKGDVEQVRVFFNSLRELVNKAQNEEGLPTSFLPLSRLSEGVVADKSIGPRTMETGISVGLSEDGSWEMRLATRQDGRIEISSTDPVIRMRPENILASFDSVDAQKQAYDQAVAEEAQLKRAAKIPGGTKAGRASIQRKLTAATNRAAAYKASLGAAKAELAATLSTEAVDKTFAGAFAQITEAQRGVAESFYGQDFREIVGELAKEMDMRPSEITPEVLATLAAEAGRTHAEAMDMAEYFDEAAAPEALQDAIFEARQEELADIAHRYAEIEEDVRIANTMQDAEMKAAVERKAAKKRRVLQAEAKVLAGRLSEDFVAAVPESFRKGSKRAVAMTKRERTREVNAILTGMGFNEGNPEVYEEVAANLPYVEEVRALADQASDALKVIEGTSQAETLIAALEGGDAEEFMARTNEVRQYETNRELAQNEARRRAESREIEPTAEGVVNAMKRGEMDWQKALELVINRTVEARPVMEALRSLEGRENMKVKLEAARRIAQILQEQWSEARSMEVFEDRPEIVAMAEFARDYSSDTLKRAYDEIIAAAQKKTPVAAA